MIRVSYRRYPDRSAGDKWIGVLRVRGFLLVECGHVHNNRDMSSAARGEAAQACARMILEGARRPETAASRAEQLRRRWQSLTSGAGFVHPASVIEGARQACAANADAYLDLVEQVREYLLDNPEHPAVPAEPATPARESVGDLPDWMLVTGTEGGAVIESELGLNS